MIQITKEFILNGLISVYGGKFSDYDIKEVVKPSYENQMGPLPHTIYIGYSDSVQLSEDTAVLSALIVHLSRIPSKYFFVGFEIYSKLIKETSVVD